MINAWIVVAAGSLVIAALLAAADGALLASPDADVGWRVAHPERAHRALALARLLAHLLTGAALVLAISRWNLSRSVALTALAVLLIVNMLVVEGLARGSGYSRGAPLARNLRPVIVTADLLFLPVTSVGLAIERTLMTLLPPVSTTTLQREADAEQFREVVAAEADVTGPEQELLHGVFSLGETEVQEIMAPRVDVVGIDKDTPWSEVLDRVRSSEHARFPVFDESLDNVIGILYAKDLLPAVVAGDEPEDWTSLIRPASFIPATKRIDRQLRDFKAQRTHIALVIDEFGGTAGVVTIEDVLEEIVGEIRDEYDVEEPEVVQEGREKYWIAGGVTLGHLSELLDHDFERDDLTTVGGLVYDAFGRVPKAGEASTIDGFRIVVERVRRRRIERVYFERLAPAAADAGESA